MLFNSFPYMLLFLPAVVLLCILMRKLAGPKAAQFLVLVASVFFYAWWKPANLPYLAASILANWVIARWMSGAAQPLRKRILITGLILNIGYLCVFKYVNFLLASFSVFGLAKLRIPDLDFPLGISFFTLTQIMYQVDCYEGLLPALGLFDHATFVSFFPYVISGPIARAKRMAHQFPQFGGEPGSRSASIARGLYLFTLGLFKKVVFADAFASIATAGFSATTHLSALEAWVFSIAYTLQIYFDFSGYSDMAIGSALMLGIEVPRNFDAPLRSKSIIEFWQRWHITLSQFITTYLYTPIVKSFRKATLFKASIATMVAMAIAGLWHGPSWNYVLFGVMHGAGLVSNQYWRKKKMPKLPAFASWLLTFVLVDVAFIFFRSRTIGAGGHMALSLVNLSHAFGTVTLSSVRGSFSGRFGVAIAIGIVLAFYGKASDLLAKEFEPKLWNSFAVAAMILACWLSMTFNTTQEFVYFKF